ncbi:protein of unknown function [Magnetospirillum gryphiswaldense MSR-1 v2]|uniref:Uncharacterized protein n=1 Tax=Magnetospirillum gryphiswaldense (strain DSM 6361 / JCM 21280 / NBRC 15271 / MSR-1) TaxID=431944 RepID=V6EXQ2_MAGGM|nr:protein of unknown function [Magnetospirillum gryphiswaldense MSR-1 v2]
MPIDPAIISRTATELLQRHGGRATTLAKEKVESASKAGDYPALDLALLVLTEVERHQGSSSTPVT